jgi:hypothetical protein
VQLDGGVLVAPRGRVELGAIGKRDFRGFYYISQISLDFYLLISGLVSCTKSGLTTLFFTNHSRLRVRRVENEGR